MTTIYDELKAKSGLYLNSFTHQERKLQTCLECFLFDEEKCFFLVQVSAPYHVVRSISRCVETLGTKFKDHYRDLMCLSWRQCAEVITSTETIYKLPSLMILDYDKVEFRVTDGKILTKLFNHVTISFSSKIIMLISFPIEDVLNLFEQHLDPAYYIILDYSARNLDLNNKELTDKPQSLIEAATLGNLNDVMRFITDGAEINMRDAASNTALHEASKRGHKSVVLFLLRHGAQHLPDHRGQTPLHIATAEGHIETVKTLVLRNADVNMSDGYGLTPLHLACTYGYKDIAIMLIECGADLEVDTKNFRTPLYIACCRNHSEVVETLLHYGAKVDPLPPNFLTALHGAADNGALNAVQLLIKFGVNREVRHDGRTALEIAESKGYMEIVEYLRIEKHPELPEEY
ncbi:ankyrin repeat domain-containing protein 29-like [Euwallacea fornicatus]|uniref:ankyrin repeat domain-containing protein 29-like n=1 Tax=Euwallacea fornicatus TaxID=995702 RepID=UPI00338F1686